MKRIFTAALIILYLSTNAQQGNFCQLLYKAFNSSGEGFQFLRPGTDAESITDYTISEDSAKYYGLKKGSILKYPNLESKLYGGKTYTAWTLLLSGQTNFLYQKNWEDVKDMIQKQFTDFTKQYADKCLVQLQISELLFPTKSYHNLLTYYFYPKQISIPKDADIDTIEDLLKEIPHIVFSVQKPALINGYFMAYSIEGIKYN